MRNLRSTTALARVRVTLPAIVLAASSPAFAQSNASAGDVQTSAQSDAVATAEGENALELLRSFLPTELVAVFI